MTLLKAILASCFFASFGYAQADLTITSLNQAGVVTDTQTLAVSGTLVVTIKNNGTSAVSSPFHIVAWEDRDGNGNLNTGADLTLGSYLYSGGLAAGRRPMCPLPLSGNISFRGDLIYVQVDSDNAVVESDETNNVSNTGNGQLPDETVSLLAKNDSAFPSSVRLTARIGNGGGSGSTGFLPGRVVVGHDAKTLGTNLAGVVESAFALNIARWLTRGKSQASLLLLELNPGDPDHQFSSQAEMAAGVMRVKSAKTKGVRTGNWLSLPQAHVLLSAPDGGTNKGLRDRAILATLLGCGLRRSEVAALSFDHLQQRDGRWCIVDLIGKHQRVRTIPMPTWVKVAVDGWTTVANLEDGKIFRSVKRGDRIQDEPLSEKAVWQLLKGYAGAAGVSGIAPHDCRRYTEFRTMPNEVTGGTSATPF